VGEEQGGLSRKENEGSKRKKDRHRCPSYERNTWEKNSGRKKNRGRQVRSADKKRVPTKESDVAKRIIRGKNGV